jgi:hypothetical protein
MCLIVLCFLSLCYMCIYICLIAIACICFLQIKNSFIHSYCLFNCWPSVQVRVIKLIISPWFTTSNKTSAEPFKCSAFVSVCCQLYCSWRRHQGTMLKNCILILPVSDPAKQAVKHQEHLLKCSFYYTSRCKLLETIKNNINHSNFEKLSFGDKFIWLLNSESKDILICMCDFLLKSHCFG